MLAIATIQVCRDIPRLSAQRKVVGVCKLCQSCAELSESHIISKFLLRESRIIGDKKRFSVWCISHPELSEHHRQDGFKEHLFCASCETRRLAPLERYAREQLYGPKSPLKSSSGHGFFWTGLNYTKMKLFTTSILWRMSLSLHPFYRRVQLGAEHEDRIRKMLFEVNPMETWRYGCSIGLLLHANKPLPGGAFSQPQRYLRAQKRYVYRFVMARFVWYFYVTSHPSGVRDEGFLQSTGVWPVPAIEASEIPFVRDEIEAFRRSTKRKSAQHTDHHS
jgi:hypothetical protein